MPQPLSRVLRNANFEIGHVAERLAALKAHPDLAALAMEAIAMWSHVENFMLSAYVDLAGGAKSDAASIYLALDTSRAKSSAITALAERKLTPENTRLLRAILKLLKSAEGERNKLAHWVWGTSPQIPHALLLSDPRNHIDIKAGIPDNLAESIEKLKDRIYVYKEKDFTDLIAKFARLAWFGREFHFIIIGHPANAGGRLYDQLCAEPEIRDTLSRQA